MKGSNSIAVTHIQDCSVNDGDGIRTVIFMAGCPLRCRWCQNPESWHTLGDHIEISDIAKIIKRHSIFYKPQGGVTFSGGEPTCQKEGLLALVDALYDLNIHMAIETCGYFEFEKVCGIFKKLDQIFFDIKHTDNIIHTQLTGVSNQLIIKSLEHIGKLQKDTIIRIPLISEINDSKENLEKTALLALNYINDPKIELLPYHSHGEYKYDKLGLSHLKYKYQAPSEEAFMHAKEIIGNLGVKIVEFK